jgi:hypothetical protein
MKNIDMMKFRPITQANLPAVEEFMKRDDHQPLAQTHVACNDNGIIGSASIGIIPFVSFWADSKAAKIRDTVQMIQCAEAILAERAKLGLNPSLGLVACRKQSPMYPYMTKLGFSQLVPVELFMKEL